MDMSLSQALTTRMNYLVARQGVIAGNIANADTPGYLSRDLTFNPHLAAAQNATDMRRTNARHMATGGSGGNTGKLVTSSNFMQHNGNSVRLDQEMLHMNQTQLDYRMMTQLYAKNAQLQQIAIGRGR